MHPGTECKAYKNERTGYYMYPKDKNLLFMGLSIAKVWLYVKEHLGTSCCMSRNAFVNNE